MKKIGLLCALVVSLSHLIAQSLILDSSYGKEGIQITDLGISTDVATDAILLSDSRIIVSGCKGVPQFDFMLLCSKPNGSVDTGFGNEGHSTYDLGNAMDDGTAIARQDNGKILIAGLTGMNSAIIRVTEEGKIDPTFGTNGSVNIQLSGPCIIRDMIIDEGGKILVVGSAGISSTEGGIGALVMRFSKNGQPDLSFGENGKIIFSLNQKTTEVQSILSLPDNRILLGISTNDYPGIVALNSNGSFCTTFADKGIFIDQQDKGKVVDLLFSADSKIILSVFFPTLTTSGLIQLNEDGRVDDSFGEKGRAIVETPGKRLLAEKIISLKSGELMMAGTLTNFNDQSTAIALCRFSKKGIWEKEPSPEGFLSYAAEDKVFSCATIVEQEDGALVIIGNVQHKSTGEKDILSLKLIANTQAVATTELPPIGQVLLYPNPVVDQSRLRFDLTQSTLLNIRLFSAQGQLSHTFVNQEWRREGFYEEEISLPPGLVKGIYFLSLETAEGFSQAIRLIKQ